eukprot:GEZU01008498.1.p1 GENE.GEZU01008498.1~~GEZU01008498.1.p1  ORF type:complete len:293 (+),score=40.87 GEZU01008498.1:562-1440(+)
MHNGSLKNFKLIKRKILSSLHDQAYSFIEGTTDSEHAGAVFIDHLGDPFQEHTTEEMACAMARTIQFLVQCLDEVQGNNSADSGMNFVVTDGKRVIATRFRNNLKASPASLYFSTTAHLTANKKHSSGSTTTSSIDGGAKEEKPKQGQESAEYTGRMHKSITVSGPNVNASDYDASREAVAKIMQDRQPIDNVSLVIIGSEPLTFNREEWTLIPANHMMIVDKNLRIECRPLYMGTRIQEFFKWWQEKALEKRKKSVNIEVPVSLSMAKGPGPLSPMQPCEGVDETLSPYAI